MSFQRIQGGYGCNMLCRKKNSYISSRVKSNVIMVGKFQCYLGKENPLLPHFVRSDVNNHKKPNELHEQKVALLNIMQAK